MIQGGSIGYEQGVITRKWMSTLGVMEEGLVFGAFVHWPLSLRWWRFFLLRIKESDT